MIGIARNLDRGIHGGDLFRRGRFELGAGYHIEKLAFASATAFHHTSNGLELDGGFAYRSRWGIFRFNVNYLAD